MFYFSDCLEAERGEGGGGVESLKGQKTAHNYKNILSVELHISWTMYYMILINGTHL